MNSELPALNRRDFVKLISLSGTALVIGCVPNGQGNEEIKKINLSKDFDVNQFIVINKEGGIILFNHRPEMGQGTFQSIPMILAEELEVDISSVEIRPSEANRDLYGSQMVVGSRSIQTEYMNLRKMGAAAREVFIEAAANRWQVPKENCRAENGMVVHDDHQASYAELVEDASKLPLSADPILKDHKDFKIIGTSVARRDIPSKTNGSAIFGMDITVPDMLYASIERSAVFLGTVVSFNEDELLKMPGVQHVFKTQRTVYGRERHGVAVLANTYWQALQARKALKIVWDDKGLEKNTTESILNTYKLEARKPGVELFKNGDSNKLLGSKDIISEEYITPYQSHVPMEPMNAIVRVANGEAEFWGSTQNPNGIREHIAQQAGIEDPYKVKINYTYMGGGFGRRSMTDVVEEATDLSIKSGKAVKVIWTREDDMTQGPFRAASFNVLKGKLDSEGNIEALEHKVVAQEIQNQTGDNMEAGGQLMGGINIDYTIPHFTVKGVLQKNYVPISYWRAVYHSTNPFAHESFIDELAHKTGKDPAQYRLDMLPEDNRFTEVLKRVMEEAHWSEKKEGIGKGIAICERSGAYFAMIVEVIKGEKGIKPIKITTAVDVGTCINPDTVKAQTEGSIVMGLTAAIKSGLEIENGRIKQQNFDTYKLLELSETPEIVTVVMKNTLPPDGAGEAGLPTVAPALANAIFDLTGKRLRRLPMDLNEV